MLSPSWVVSPSSVAEPERVVINSISSSSSSRASIVVDGPESVIVPVTVSSIFNSVLAGVAVRETPVVERSDSKFCSRNAPWKREPFEFAE